MTTKLSIHLKWFAFKPYISYKLKTLKGDNMPYIKLSDKLRDKILEDNPHLQKNLEKPLRRRMEHDKPNLWRPAYVRDIEKILHSPYYNRYADKTQVFSFYKNDDISRRSLHVQLVSRIAKNISQMLGLDVNLTEAIALGHDIGHTPFGHAGESCINEISLEKTGRAFMHNLQSVRVLDKIFDYNITLNTLDGILCHNGELPLDKYTPEPYESFEKFDEMVEECYIDSKASRKLVPATLEGCVVRISDLIAYIGKDRQDSIRAKVIQDENVFSAGSLGRFNASIINNLIVNVIENSYGKNYIKLDKEYYDDLMLAMKENYELIYLSESVKSVQQEVIKPMFAKVFDSLLKDILNNKKDSVIFRHHINYISKVRSFYSSDNYAELNTPEDIVIDYISSMTDDYFSDLYAYLFPKSTPIKYVSYFDSRD